MAASIDIKRNSGIKLTARGYQAERVAIVSGVTGTAAEVLYNAINDAALPNIGDVHPDVASITLNDINCTPIGGGQYRVVMRYYKDAGVSTNSSNAEARVNSGLAVEETHEDIGGQPLDTAYRVGVASTVNQRFTAEVERPRMTFHFEYTAGGVPTTDIAKYLGKINSATWNGYPVNSILCSSIDVEPNGANYRVSYSFSYRPESWVFIGKTKFAPVDIVSTDDDALDIVVGLKSFDVYRSVDFSVLGFALPEIAYPLTAGSGAFRLTGSDATLTVG